jgi:hypothetical protein
VHRCGVSVLFFFLFDFTLTFSKVDFYGV